MAHIEEKARNVDAELTVMNVVIRRLYGACGVWLYIFAARPPRSFVKREDAAWPLTRVLSPPSNKLIPRQFLEKMKDRTETRAMRLEGVEKNK